MNESKFLYSVNRVRVLETKLLDRPKIERMIEAKNAEEVIKVLSETEYSGSISEMASIEDYEKILQNEIANTYKFIKEISPVPELTNIFLFKYDIHNIKTILKSSYMGQENNELLSTIGTIPLKSLKEMFKEENYNELPEEVRQAIFDIKSYFEKSPDPQIIDIILDKALYGLMYDVVSRHKNQFLMDFISAQIDMINIRTFIRVKAMGYGRVFLEKVMLQNGKLGFDFFSKLYDEPLETLVEKLWISDYYRVADEGIESYKRTKSLTKLEKLADDYILGLAKKGKYVVFGIEPLIGYIMAKEHEVKIIRIIMVGKINGIPNDIIRERLRDVYV